MGSALPVQQLADRGREVVDAERLVDEAAAPALQEPVGAAVVGVAAGKQDRQVGGDTAEAVEQLAIASIESPR